MQALMTGNVEVPANPHELITDETSSVKHKKHDNKVPRGKGMMNFNREVREFYRVFSCHFDRSENHERTEDCHQQR